MTAILFSILPWVKDEGSVKISKGRQFDQGEVSLVFTCIASA